MNYTSTNGPRRFKGMFILFFFAAAFGLSAIVMWLWNAILPQVTGATTITYWQSMGLLVLARILFGGFHFRKPYGKRPPFAQKHFREKWMNMSAEDREKMKEEWRRRCSK